ncbi:hypothetical protein A2304_02200 [Candidatus Uhrbacteria bacterium RIFOXYB2_FULL_57_15]|uniref:HD/PDEase domain-containing protein n=1 Tax=Candidatus Uhrbacteria bacterium RIFOXYB2_FULL_57_15 TaxID=1802422 RepID=A0A1F7W6R7_9BACT|nr:MAG: hypothetical protein A2304_02200 [Candidatus Uhrbacteria bacterium RIFOXYB2_FULL_57_15]OGL99204.1 MAG: hypothetical protein A2501_03335 [Candidatus Uhrbacteria bacterium RIFOXYC12_FULL_57_11]
MSDYELRDPIHHRIAFDEFERRIIDHPFFQRLRFISQLSFLQTYVYPGANHTRFTHCLGAMHIAGRLFAKVIAGSNLIVSRLSPDEMEGIRRRIRVAGLLHDIGHGPFSHESESVFPQFDQLPLDWTWWSEGKTARRAKHEDYSVLLIQTLADEKALDREFAQDVASLVHGGVRPSAWFASVERKIPTLQSVLKLLISGEADCDRMDYLLRDSYDCGVAYGNFDIDWLISSMGIGEREGRLVLTIAENGVRAFESFLLARYHMFDQVYFHKTKAGFIYYLEKAILSGEIPLVIPTDPYAYAQMRDGAVIETMFEAARRPNHYWSEHLIRRLPAHRILRLQEARQEDHAVLEELTRMCEENQIGYFTHRAGKELSSLTESDRLMFVIHKTVSGEEMVPMFQYSDLLKKYNEKLQIVDFFVVREDAGRFRALQEKMTAMPSA